VSTEVVEVMTLTLEVSLILFRICKLCIVTPFCFVQDEKLQIQTQQLATLVVDSLLNDPEVLNRASDFLRRLLNKQETQEHARIAIGVD
jgi:hypothetical protein